MESRRRRYRAQTAAEIRARAAEVVAERGVDALSMRGLAADLGMAASGVHHYFASRDELIAAVVIDVFSALAAHLPAAGTDPDPVDDWLLRARAYADWAAANPELWQLAHSRTATALKGTPGLLAAKDLVVRALLPELPLRGDVAVGPVLEGQLRAWSAALGEVADPARQVVALHLYAVLHGQVHLSVTGSLPRELLDGDALLEAQLRLALQGCLAPGLVEHAAADRDR